jgi:hypothetical protein
MYFLQLFLIGCFFKVHDIICEEELQLSLRLYLETRNFWKSALIILNNKLQGYFRSSKQM